MSFGLTPEAITLIQNVFAQYPQIQRVQVFGSRAMGNYRDNSDIDLVIWGAVNEALLAKIASELDSLPLPYLFDVKAHAEITHAGLLEHIQKFGKNIYSN